jgi:hypothetical protein
MYYSYELINIKLYFGLGVPAESAALNFPGVVEDFSKWIIYWMMAPKYIEYVPLQSALLYGSLAGVSSLILKELFFNIDQSRLGIEFNWELWQRLLNRVIESAVLFGVFESTINICEHAPIIHATPNLKEFLSEPWFPSSCS